MSETSAYRSQLAVTPAAQAKVIWPRAEHPVVVDIIDTAALTVARADWANLLDRAAAPNAFLDPTLIRAAAEADSQNQHRVVMAWRAPEGRRQLAGVWAFAIRRPRTSPLPISVLAAPTFDHCYLATPVVDRDGMDETLEAMLDGVAGDPQLPNIIALDMMGEGVTADALMRVLAQRGSPAFVFSRSSRPKLESTLDGKGYLEKAVSASTRKKLRQHRRKLAEKGALTSVVVSEPDAVRWALDEFLSMELAGWKGRQGTALLNSNADAAFMRSAVGALADAGGASIHSLYLDTRPVSMQIVVRSGAAAFTWKTTYNEAFQDYSPGMLLLEDYTSAFLQDKSIAFVDSCSFDDSGFMSAWTERQPVVDLWIDTRRGGSPMFRALCLLQQNYREARSTAKRLYLAWRKSNWSKSRKR